VSRIARIALEGVPYHITQRGNGRQQVFFDDRDYAFYLVLLRSYSRDADLRLWAFCIMSNHVHLIAVPQRPNAMASALGRTHADYARHCNLRRLSCGHVWQARYFSCPLEGAHLWHAMSYVERNPVRAGLVRHAEQYRWSSARVHLGLDSGGGLVDLAAWRAQYDQRRWKEVLETSVEDQAFGQRLQEASRRGRPLGGKEFTKVLEERAGRVLSPQPAGRPRKRHQNVDDQLSLKIGI
jgi:putative transposase